MDMKPTWIGLGELMNREDGEPDRMAWLLVANRLGGSMATGESWEYSLRPHRLPWNCMQPLSQSRILRMD